MEIVSAIVFLGLTAFFLIHNSNHPPHGLELTTILGMVVACIVFITLVVRERVVDERELAHTRSAGRVSYLVGIALLVSAIIYQALTGHVDMWLVVTLCAMLIVKIIARLYLHYRR